MRGGLRGSAASSRPRTRAPSILGLCPPQGSGAPRLSACGGGKGGDGVQFAGAFPPCSGWRGHPSLCLHSCVGSSVPGTCGDIARVPGRRGGCAYWGLSPVGSVNAAFLAVRSYDGPFGMISAKHGDCNLSHRFVPKSHLAEHMSRPLQRCEET